MPIPTWGFSALTYPYIRRSAEPDESPAETLGFSIQPSQIEAFVAVVRLSAAS